MVPERDRGDEDTDPDVFPDLTAHAHAVDSDDTPVTVHACARCGGVCIEVQQYDRLGGLPEWCAHSVDHRWKYCKGTGPQKPERIVYYPSGPPKP